MNEQKSVVSRRRSIGRKIILLFCLFVNICVFSVLIFAYKPNQNALGALGSVCMDVICILILSVLAISIAYENGGLSRTTKLFLGLIAGTLYALFFDFLTWSSDGSLAFGGWTNVFTVASLCSGAILAGVFVFYLCSYIDDMYDTKAPFLSAKICAGFNLFAFVLTVTLAQTKYAFKYVDGHYETGALYGFVTVIPILTLFYMTGYVIRYVKVIGIHDVVAVVGYMFTMITGAVIEEIYGIGTTYVGVAIADIIIFVMLQNKLIDRVKKQKEMLAEKITSQYEILDSMAGIYLYVNYIDLKEKTVQRFDLEESIAEHLDLSGDPHTELNKKLYAGIEDELKDKFWTYTDLSTLSARMQGEKIISSEFCHKETGWFRALYIRIGEATNGPVEKVIYAVRNIDEEKKNVEKWIRKSNTDELTGFYNRHAYEEDIAAYENGNVKDNFVYVSIDVNSLKVVNDSLGHNAGDELIVGASECIRQCFGAYGKLYRTGGDEFVALIYADDAQLIEIQKDIHDITESWSGKLIDCLAISIGYAKQKEMEDVSVRQLAVIADKRMYEDKAKYYRKKGMDRRGQRDAHMAISALYTKILKINISDDTYRIINMDENEQTEEKGYTDKISQWLYDFGVSGQIHPDDLEDYLSKTNPEYMRNFFINNKNSSLTIYYRRKNGDGYNKVMMEIIPANDYSDTDQNLFLYVKNMNQ